MFRKMRRFKQQISDAECIDVLKNTKEGDWALQWPENRLGYGLMTI